MGFFEKVMLFGAIGIVISSLLLFTAITCTGCRSNTGRTDGTILEYQKQIDRLEEELRNRDTTVTNTISELRNITERSSTMEGTVDAIINLFEQYQRRVEQLFFDYNKIRAETETTFENNLNTNSIISN